MEMTLDLSKGMSLDLTKTSDTVFEFALSWPPATTGVDIDIDASAFLMNTVGNLKKLTVISNVVYFKEPFLVHASGAVKHSGDSTDGKSEGDDEVITVDTSKIPADITQVRIYINIFAPAVAFGAIPNAKVQVRTLNGNVLATFNMSTDFATENSILVGTVEKVNGNWSFVASGEGYSIADLNTIVKALAEGVE